LILSLEILVVKNKTKTKQKQKQNKTKNKKKLASILSFALLGLNCRLTAAKKKKISWLQY